MRPISHLSRTCHLKGRDIADILAELYPDQMNRLIQPPIFVRISLCLQLRHCSPFRRQFHHLELEQIHSVVETNRHVQTPIAATVFHNDVEAHRGEVGVEHAGVVAFVVRYVIVCVPLVGDAGKERLEQAFQASEVIDQQQVVQTGADALPVAL